MVGLEMLQAAWQMTITEVMSLFKSCLSHHMKVRWRDWAVRASPELPHPPLRAVPSTGTNFLEVRAGRAVLLSDMTLPNFPADM